MKNNSFVNLKSLGKFLQPKSTGMILVSIYLSISLLTGKVFAESLELNSFVCDKEFANRVNNISKKVKNMWLEIPTEVNLTKKFQYYKNEYNKAEKETKIAKIDFEDLKGYRIGYQFAEYNIDSRVFKKIKNKMGFKNNEKALNYLRNIPIELNFIVPFTKEINGQKVLKIVLSYDNKVYDEKRWQKTWVDTIEKSGIFDASVKNTGLQINTKESDITIFQNSEGRYFARTIGKLGSPIKESYIVFTPGIKVDVDWKEVQARVETRQYWKERDKLDDWYEKQLAPIEGNEKKEEELYKQVKRKEDDLLDNLSPRAREIRKSYINRSNAPIDCWALYHQEIYDKY